MPFESDKDRCSTGCRMSSIKHLHCAQNVLSSPCTNLRRREPLRTPTLIPHDIYTEKCQLNPSQTLIYTLVSSPELLGLGRKLVLRIVLFPLCRRRELPRRPIISGTQLAHEDLPPNSNCISEGQIQHSVGDRARSGRDSRFSGRNPDETVEKRVRSDEGCC